ICTASLTTLIAVCPAFHLASLAKWKAGQTAIKVVNEAVQMHGGIGVTDELDVGLFLKRIRVAQACLGDADYHCERYGALELAHA
ncbi:acyl-CoA dehydrogenase family protein, partial [Pseudomonas sp. FSL R10-1339]|uniref:acyl-CoA dehydrogenase family protein n=1 Tax=Pseudomonas sp. FSL R10-1339 TaxID=2662196 RepID=UPI0013548689